MHEIILWVDMLSFKCYFHYILYVTLLAYDGDTSVSGGILIYTHLYIYIQFSLLVDYVAKCL